MKGFEAEQRLRYHAGLSPEPIEGVPSISDAIWARGRIEESVDDALTALESLNRDINGAIPSESKAQTSDFSRRLVYAVTEIIRMLRDDRANEVSTRSAWKIETAWSAILAGDIDNLREHIAQEEAALDS